MILAQSKFIPNVFLSSGIQREGKKLRTCGSKIAQCVSTLIEIKLFLAMLPGVISDSSFEILWSKELSAMIVNSSHRYVLTKIWDFKFLVTPRKRRTPPDLSKPPRQGCWFRFEETVFGVLKNVPRKCWSNLWGYIFNSFFARAPTLNKF